jgi:CheY-like chemotaxis protein
MSNAREVVNQPFTTMKFPKKILLIDHEPGVTRLIRRALERAGKYLIREEHDDKLAINAARWFQPDLILVDTAGQDRRNIEREISSDAALKDTPVLSLSNLRPESQMVSGGILNCSSAKTDLSSCSSLDYSSRSFPAEIWINLSSRFSRVSSFLALTIHHLTAFR